LLQSSSSNPAPPPTVRLALSSPRSAGIRTLPLHRFTSLPGFLACAPHRQIPAASLFSFLTPNRTGHGRSIGDASCLLQLPQKNPAPPSQPPSRRRRSRFFSVFEPSPEGGERRPRPFFLSILPGRRIYLVGMNDREDRTGLPLVSGEWGCTEAK
jgi:hypothetical protein